MRYETLIVLHPDLPDAQVRETIDRARTVALLPYPVTTV